MPRQTRQNAGYEGLTDADQGENCTLPRMTKTAPPEDPGNAWVLDVTRLPAGYTLSNGNQTAVNTSGGADYRRWVPSAKPILPTDWKRYWEVLCAASGAAAFDGYIGVVSAAQRE